MASSPNDILKEQYVGEDYFKHFLEDVSILMLATWKKYMNIDRVPLDTETRKQALLGVKRIISDAEKTLSGRHILYQMGQTWKYHKRKGGTKIVSGMGIYEALEIKAQIQADYYGQYHFTQKDVKKAPPYQNMADWYSEQGYDEEKFRIQMRDLTVNHPMKLERSNRSVDSGNTLLAPLDPLSMVDYSYRGINHNDLPSLELEQTIPSSASLCMMICPRLEYKQSSDWTSDNYYDYLMGTWGSNVIENDGKRYFPLQHIMEQGDNRKDPVVFTADDVATARLFSWEEYRGRYIRGIHNSIRIAAIGINEKNQPMIMSYDFAPQDEGDIASVSITPFKGKVLNETASRIFNLNEPTNLAKDSVIKQGQRDYNSLQWIGYDDMGMTQGSKVHHWAYEHSFPYIMDNSKNDVEDLFVSNRNQSMWYDNYGYNPKYEFKATMPPEKDTMGRLLKANEILGEVLHYRLLTDYPIFLGVPLDEIKNTKAFADYRNRWSGGRNMGKRIEEQIDFIRVGMMPRMFCSHMADYGMINHRFI
jgi:hypothetical protein